MNKVELLKRWETSKLWPSRALIHTLRPHYQEEDPDHQKTKQAKPDPHKTSPLMTLPAEHVFATWDIISATLIDFNRVGIVDVLNPRRRNSFQELGFILDVPIQNIVGMHHQDLWFPNHAGTVKDPGSAGGRRVTDSNALTDALYKGIRVDGKQLMPKGFHQIRIPGDMLYHTRLYNEVLIVGRSGVNTYPGLPQTGRIKIREVAIFRHYIHENAEEGGSLERYRLVQRRAEKLRALNGVTAPVRIL
ncbi:hypothetical protein [Pseudomonas defluvii]|uniref:hypothetical protein n=1 Tax=Pseudomonas defluvii TaxID=1876757 RepID=UPI000811A0A3|nr:hypothetical protein [Pseudomonas defluvii]